MWHIMVWRLSTRALIAGFSLLMVACGSDSRSPTSPSLGDLGTVATIRGQVRSLGNGDSSVFTGLTVGVVGSALSTMVESSGWFTLGNVEPGPVRLRFTGAGIDAQLDIGPVQSGQIIDVKVTVNGSDVVLDDRSDSAEDTHLEGPVTSLGGACPSVTFRIGGTLVRASVGTMFDDGGCTALRNGDRVRVDGIQQPDGSVQATEIEVDELENGRPGDDGPDSDGGSEVHPEGAVTSLGGACPSLTFRVDGIVVRTSAATMFDDGGCTALRNGDRVRVDGIQQPDGSVQATEVEIDEPDDDDAAETVALNLEIDPDEWRLDWAAGSQSGSGGASVRIRISGSAADRIDPDALDVSGPGGTIQPERTEVDEDLEAEFSKVDAISLVGGAQDGETVLIAVQGRLADGTPFSVERNVSIRE